MSASGYAVTGADREPSRSAAVDEPPAAAGRVIALALNESPYPPLPRVLNAMDRAVRQSNRYPDPACSQLTAALARHHGIPIRHLAVGAGSITLADQLMAALTTPGEAIIQARPGFGAYTLLAQRHRLDSIGIPLVGETHDLDAMIRAVRDRNTRLVVVCNPHNPTGTVVPARALESFLDQVPPQVLVLLDEAYHEYALGQHTADGLTLYLTRPNVMLLRTFSKGRGLAGLRVGYLIAHDPIAAAVRARTLPFSVSHLGQAAALASLQADRAFAIRIRYVAAERDRVRTALAAQGWDVPPSCANFLWIRLGHAAARFAGHCAAHGIAIQLVHGEGVRITIGTREENDTLISVAAAAGAPRPLTTS